MLELGRKNESCYSTICDVMTVKTQRKMTQFCWVQSIVSVYWIKYILMVGSAYQGYLYAVFIGWLTAYVRSESDRNEASLKLASLSVAIAKYILCLLNQILVVGSADQDRLYAVFIGCLTACVRSESDRNEASLKLASLSVAIAKYILCLLNQILVVGSAYQDRLYAVFTGCLRVCVRSESDRNKASLKLTSLSVPIAINSLYMLHTEASCQRTGYERIPPRLFALALTNITHDDYFVTVYIFSHLTAIYSCTFKKGGR